VWFPGFAESAGHDFDGVEQRSIIDGAINEAHSTYRTSSLIHPECEECMLKHLRMFTMVALAATVISAAGCSKGTATDNQSPNTASKSPDKVTYVTAFGAVGRDAFAWVALKKGYFTEANLDVTIQLGAAVDQNLSALAAGQAQFAALDLTGAMIQAGKGTFKDFRAIAAIHQQTLVSIVGLEGGKVTQPKDLEGKKVGAATGSVNQLLFPAYAKLAGIDPAKVTFVNVAPPQLPALLASSQVDALSTFLIGKGGIEKAAGKKTVILPYSDYLSDLYGNALVTSAQLSTQNPDLVKRFRDAALKGLKWTIENPKEAADILKEAQPTADLAAATGEITLMAPYVKPSAATAPIGALNQQQVARAIAILQGAGLIPSGLTPDAVVNFDLTPAT
jgi:NitT/TauT family transport system substrate-binding protein